MAHQPPPPARLTHRRPAGPRPAPGAAKRPRPNKYTWRGCASNEDGSGLEATGRPPGGGRWGTRAQAPLSSPPTPPLRPAVFRRRATRAPALHPPQGRREVPPPPERAAAPGKGGAAEPVRNAPPRPHPPAPRNPRQRTRAPHGPRPGTTPEHEPEQCEGHALYDQSDANDTSFVACPGKAEGRTEVGRPPAPQGPPAAPPGRKGHRPPPPPAPPARERPGSTGPPKRGHTIPSQARGERDWPAPPPRRAKQGTGPRQDTRRGTDRVERPYQRPAPEPRRTDPGRGGRADAARARAHAHTKGMRRIPEGQPDRARGTHGPHGVAYQQARIKDSRMERPATQNAGNAGREGGNGEDTKPGTGLSPPEPAASAAHTRTAHCTRQGSSGAPRHAPALPLGSLGASPRGSHWRQASSTGPAVPAPRATTHWGGDAVGKRLQLRLLSDALTREW